MKAHFIIVAAALVTASLAIGCKSPTEKCVEEAQKAWQDRITACKDEACKSALGDGAVWTRQYEEECIRITG